MQKLMLGPFPKGLRNDQVAFAIDNDSFPTLLNAYQWRGRVKRKRGTSLLGRLARYFDSLLVSYNTGTTTITLDGTGAGNLLTNASWTLETNSSIVPGSVEIIGTLTYTDPAMDGTLSPTGTINYSTGAILIAAQANNAVSANFRYYPVLPVMGFEDLNLRPTQNAGNIAFDTKYSYNVLSAFPYSNYDVTFYKNPPGSGKTNSTPFRWNGQNYQQFWTTNYQNAFWATNGVTVPFNPTNVGMQFLKAADITSATRTSATTVDFVIASTPLVVGDFVFANEYTGTSGSTLNFQTGYVTAVVGTTYTVTFPNATIGAAGLVPGILQYLTNSSDATKDCLRFYDGDPTNGSVTDPVLNGVNGWVNFCPPLSYLDYSIADLPQDQYYLVTCKMMFSYRDRLVCLGPVVQTSTGIPIYLPDTAIYSQNGTPYYTCSFTGDPTLPTTQFNALLLPTNQTSTANAWYEDVIGYGGFRSAGRSESIISMEFNEDVPIIGFQTFQTRFIYTSNDVQPFDFYLINTEYGTISTYSAINTDRGVITRGSRGIIITSQVDCQRIDPLIPDQVFEMKLINNGAERMCSQRDFVNEWIYMTYPSNQDNYSYPTETLFYNYRDVSWAIFKETYTCYGLFRKQTGFTWDTVGLVYPTWNAWNDPWNSGTSTLLNPEVVGGNQQGFLIIKADGTSECESLFIQNISGSTVTSPDHCLSEEDLQEGDYITIKNVLGTIGPEVNGKVFSIQNVTANTFVLNPNLENTGTYLGGGVIVRLYRPYIQTKQFPAFWDSGNKVRIGVQQYLLTKTGTGRIQLLIFLSQNGQEPYNTGPIYPLPNSLNDSLVFSSVLFTCPESTNLGLTPFNSNLQMPTAIQQQQIWHRMNTSLIGDTVQIGFTLSDEQMRDPNIQYQVDEIELFGIIMELYPAGLLA
jgi:hypothetical protein